MFTISEDFRSPYLKKVARDAPVLTSFAFFA